MYLKPLLGWIAGIHLDDLGRQAPQVVNGATGEFDGARAIVMHVPLPDEQYARLDIVNLFEPGDGDRIRFTEAGFHAHECLVNGKLVNFADYLATHKIDTRLPLVADYSGAMINVSVKGVDAADRRVDFYAPCSTTPSTAWRARCPTSSTRSPRPCRPMRAARPGAATASSTTCTPSSRARAPAPSPAP
jgi:hypothetical protein